MHKKRESEGEYVTLYNELVDDEHKFHQYFRMSKRQFNYLLNIMEDTISKRRTKFREPMTAKEKLAVCLR